MPISSSKDSNRIASIPQLTGHNQRWHTLMALPGQNTLVRRDLRGLRPSRFEASNKGHNQMTGGRPQTGGDTFYSADEDQQPISRRIARTPLLPPLSNSAVSGHAATSVSQSIQTRMAVAGQAAAARARVTNNRP